MAAAWNEEELKMHFISPTLMVADTNIPDVYKTYFERPLSGILDGYSVHLITECMVALPKLAGDPDKPYFFLQEFKQTQHYGKTDPQGLMLAAMLLAQKPIKMVARFMVVMLWITTGVLPYHEDLNAMLVNSLMLPKKTTFYKSFSSHYCGPFRKLKDLILNR